MGRVIERGSEADRLGLGRLVFPFDARGLLRETFSLVDGLFELTLLLDVGELFRVESYGRLVSPTRTGQAEHLHDALGISRDKDRRRPRELHCRSRHWPLL